MKSKILGLLAVGLLAGPISASAAAITYDFTASTFARIVGDANPAPFDPVTGSFTLDGSTLLGFQLSLGSKVFGLSDVGIQISPAGATIGALVNGINVVSGSTDDFLLGFGALNYSFQRFVYSVQGVNTIWGSGTGTITQRAAVPEPGTLALLGLGLAGLGLSRRRKA